MFAFLFLIPFVVDPAISTIVADYDQIPVTCIVVDHTYAEGLRNCTWSSCREGCTNAATRYVHTTYSLIESKMTQFSLFSHRCHQLLVNYTKIPWHEWQQHPRKIGKIEWDVADTKLLINSEGCGYPPHVNCTEFAKKYGYDAVGGESAMDAQFVILFRFFLDRLQFSTCWRTISLLLQSRLS